MDGGSGPLYGAAELEGEDADDETQQGEDQPYLRHQLKPKSVLEGEVTSGYRTFHHSFKILVLEFV